MENRIEEILSVLLRIEKLLAGREEPKRKKADAVSTAVLWQAYSANFIARYRVEPERNASVNGVLAQVAKRVPAADHGALMAFFVRQNDAWYLKQMHSPKCLLQDVEMLLTRMRSGLVITDSKARQLEQAQSNAQAAQDFRERKRGGENRGEG